MTDDALPDWIKIDDAPVLTEDEIRDAWERLVRTNLKGKVIDLGCRGGDGYNVKAVIETVIPILGVGVLFKVHSATIIADEERDKDLDTQPENLPQATWVLFNDLDCPPEFRDNSILFPLGAPCLDRTGETQVYLYRIYLFLTALLTERYFFICYFI